MTIIFFSGNLHKAREIEAIFAPFRVRIYTDFMKPFSVVESGKTFSDNAKIKLNALKSVIESQGFDAIFKGEVEQKDCILMAEDSGICVEALGNLPHIFSARFANLPPLASLQDISKIAPHPVIARRSRSNPNKMDCHDSTRCVESRNDDIKDSTDSENIARLIGELKAKNLSESKAQFISCVACCKLSNSLKNSSLGASFALGENFGNQQTPSLVLSQNFLQDTKSPPQILELDSNKNDSSDSTESSLRGRIADSHEAIQNFCDSKNGKNQSRVSATLKALSGVGVGVVREGEGSDFAIRKNPCIQAPTPSLKKNARRQKGEFNADLSAESRKKIDLNELPQDNAKILTTHGFLNGKVITQTRGTNGFGYDPIFIPNGFESTLAEMPREAKNALSHRKIALDLMRLILCPLSAKNLS